MYVCSKLSGINNNLHVAKSCKSRIQTGYSEDNSMLSGASARTHKQPEVTHVAGGWTHGLIWRLLHLHVPGDGYDDSKSGLHWGCCLESTYDLFLSLGLLTALRF